MKPHHFNIFATIDFSLETRMEFGKISLQINELPIFLCLMHMGRCAYTVAGITCRLKCSS